MSNSALAMRPVRQSTSWVVAIALASLSLGLALVWGTPLHAQAPAVGDAPPPLHAPPQGEPQQAPQQAPQDNAAEKSKLVVLVDTSGTQISIDGEKHGSAPVSIAIGEGRHAIGLTAPSLPPFFVDVDVRGDGRTEVSVKLAQHRPAADFAQRKQAYDDASFSTGVKGIGSICGCGTGGTALATGAVLGVIGLSVPAIATAIGGAAACVGGVGLCGWTILNLFDLPDEPTIPRVHVVKITPPGGAAEARVLEITAPPVDSDGEPLGEDDDESKDDKNGDIVEAVQRF